jgi:hypothetical protein
MSMDSPRPPSYLPSLLFPNYNGKTLPSLLSLFLPASSSSWVPPLNRLLNHSESLPVRVEDMPATQKEK